MTSMIRLSSSSVSRRSALFGGAAFLWATAAMPAIAFSTEGARSLIDRVVADINGIINSGRSESAMLHEFEGVFARYADGATIGQLVLGPDGRSASAAQKSAFSRAFQVYISRKYGRRFREFIGGRIEVVGARPVKSYYEVQSVAHLAGQAPFAVDFVVADRNGLFIDMRIEGVSLVKAERAEIGAMLDKRRGNLDQLIADLGAMG